MFATACRKSSPKVHENPVIVKSFSLALQRTRSAYHLYGRAEVVGTEVESLGAFVIQILIRELLDDAFAAIPSSQRASSMKSLRGIVEGIVNDAATMTWKKCVDEAYLVDGSLRETIHSNLPLLLDAEETLGRIIGKEITAIVNPMMKDLVSGSIAPFLSIVVEPVILVHSIAVTSFWEAMRAWIRGNTSSSHENKWDWSKKYAVVTDDLASIRLLEYHQYGAKHKRRSVTGSGSQVLKRNTSFTNTAYTRNKSSSAADAMLYNPGFPLLKRTSSMPVEDRSFGKSLTLSRSNSMTSGAAVEELMGAASQEFAAAKSESQIRIISELFKCHVDIDSQSDGPLLECARVLWNLYTSDLASFNSGQLSESLTAYDVYTYELDSLQVLLHNAAYTLESAAMATLEAELIPPHLLRLADDVTLKLFQDTKKSVVDGLVALSYDLIRCTVQEMIELPCVDVAIEHASRIPSALHNVLSTESLAEAAVKIQVESILRDVVSEFCSKRLSSIQCPAMPRTSAL